MGTRVFEIEFGWNYDKTTVVAENYVEAVEKAIKTIEQRTSPREWNANKKDYWIRKVEMIVETDD